MHTSPRFLRSLLALGLAFVLLTGLAASAQVTVRLLGSPANTYVFLLPQPGQNMYQNVLYYRVLRSAQGRNNFREVGRISFHDTYAAYRQRINSRLDSLLRARYRTDNGSQLLDSIQRNPGAYSLALIDPQLWTENGWLFQDRDVRSGNTYDYQVVRVGRDGTITPVFTGAVQAGGQQALVRRFRFRSTSYQFSDSTVVVGWNSQGLPLAQQQALAAGLTSVWDPLVQGPLFYTIYRRVSDGPWQKLCETLGTITGSVFGVKWLDRVLPEQVYQYVLLPTDFLGNVGQPSDTITAFPFNRYTLPTITGLMGRDTTGGIRLRWNRLPEKAYLRGLVITRSVEENGPVERTDTVGINITTWFDRQAMPYQGRYYRVRPLVIPFPGSDTIAYRGTNYFATYTRLPTPTPPRGLQARPEGRHVRLTWTVTDPNKVFGVYVFRGTSPVTMLPVSPAIQNGTWLDTASVLSGRTTYLYAVQQMTGNQVSSDFSDTVSIQPLRPVQVLAPAGLNAVPYNAMVLITWTDMRQTDNAVIGYVLERQTSSTGPFSMLIPGLIDKKSWIDTTARPGLSYAYRLACVSFSRDTSGFTAPVRVDVPGRTVALYQVREFSVRNTTAGIELRLPPVQVSGVSAYRVYRRERGSNQPFEQVTQLTDPTRPYVDTQVVADRVYVYSVTSLERNIESERVTEQTLRREVPKSSR